MKKLSKIFESQTVVNNNRNPKKNLTYCIHFPGFGRKLINLGNRAIVIYGTLIPTPMKKKIEIDKILTPLFFDNQKKLSCVISSMNMVKLLTVELQENLNIYKSIDNFFNILNSNLWIKNYIFWELNFFKLIGYDLALKDMISVDNKNGEKIYFVKSKNIKKIIPNFLIESNSDPKNDIDLLNGLKLVSDYLEKSILRPNNINYPKSRLAFIDLLK